MEATLQVLGKQEVAGYEFTGIEGGFGDSKKSMLVKDIAKIHNRPTKKINELIKNNIKRFKNDVDIIDLKQVVSKDLFSDYGFTKAQWGNAKHIYLLSERGYSKLLKILEDDVAWDIYDKFVDNYFTMREMTKQIVDDDTPSYMIENKIDRANKWIEEQKETERLALTVEQNQPKVTFADAMLSSKKNIIVREFAKHAVDKGIKNAGQDRIYKWLRDNSWVIKQDGTDYNLPTQKSMEAGLMDIKVSVGNNGQEFRTTVITPKGQQYFINLWLQNGFQFEATGIVLKNVKRKRRLSDKQLQDTFDLLKRGFSQGEVARALDISQPTVWKRIQMYRQEFGY